MVGYSLHQLLRYMAAHSGWHLLLPVMGDSQRVPNGAEALGKLVDGAAVAADSGIANLRASVHLCPSCYPLSRRWPTGLSQSLSLTIKSAHYIITPPRRRYLGHSIRKHFCATVASRGK